MRGQPLPQGTPGAGPPAAGAGPGHTVRSRRPMLGYVGAVVALTTSATRQLRHHRRPVRLCPTVGHLDAVSLPELVEALRDGLGTPVLPCGDIRDTHAFRILLRQQFLDRPENSAILPAQHKAVTFLIATPSRT